MTWCAITCTSWVFVRVNWTNLWVNLNYWIQWKLKWKWLVRLDYHCEDCDIAAIWGYSVQPACDCTCYSSCYTTSLQIACVSLLVLVQRVVDCFMWWCNTSILIPYHWIQVNSLHTSLKAFCMDKSMHSSYSIIYRTIVFILQGIEISHYFHNEAIQITGTIVSCHDCNVVETRQVIMVL